jgi:hypothetical protein
MHAVDQHVTWRAIVAFRDFSAVLLGLCLGYGLAVMLDYLRRRRSMRLRRPLMILILVAAAALAGCGTSPVYECYLKPHVVGQQTNYTGPCTVAPEGKYPTAKGR